MAKLYKYMGPEHIDKVFGSTDKVTLKCSLPREFNDPYELFLTIDFNERPDALAFYADVIGDIPQFPTTCFSKSPSVTPMWAHYATNLEGFAVELVEEKLSEPFQDSRLGDVTYSDTPAEDLSELLYRAYVIGKFRYTYFLQRAVFNAAYFTKALFWSYEQERRLVVSESHTRAAGPLKLLDAPSDCVSSIICGPRATQSTRQALKIKSEEFGCRYLEMRIGKSSAIPYFVDCNGDPFSFDVNDITPRDHCCDKCREPLFVATDRCSWCQIDDELRLHAASRNPFRILDRAGLLKSYIEEMDAVGKERKI